MDNWAGYACNPIELTLNPGQYWDISFAISGQNRNPVTTWRKNYGSTPVGVYTALCPNVVPQTLTVT